MNITLDLPLEESVGVINSRPDITDSQEYARRLRHEAETRERA
jgi:hypothetical protein